LSRYTGVAPVDWKFVKSAHGKPSIAEPAEFSSLQFNLTRTDGLIVCLVSRAGEVGVDAEETSRPVDIAQVARHFFSAKEQASLAACAPERRGKRFFEQWVLKEAYLKGRGTGLSETPPMLTIELGNDGRPMPVDDWQLALHDPSPQHVAATAIRARRGAPAIPISWFDALGLINARVAIVGGRVPDIRP
jgi:4'-phosphopantetheinyl transferase